MLSSRFVIIFSNVVNPNTLNLDPDPEYWPNMDPDPVLCYYQFEKKIYLKPNIKYWPRKKCVVVVESLKSDLNFLPIIYYLIF